MNMNVSKKWIIGFMLIALSAGTMFANGNAEDNDGRYGPNGNHQMMGNQGMNGPQGMRGNQGKMGDWDDMETRTIEGKFSLVEDRYPSVTTSEGETFYLLIHFPMEDNQIPAEGANLKIEALQSPMAPNQLIVVSGEADGVEFNTDMDMNGSNGYCGNGRHGRNGHGRNGRQGMMGNNGMNGNPQGWGTPAPVDNQ